MKRNAACRQRQTTSIATRPYTACHLLLSTTPKLLLRPSKAWLSVRLQGACSNHSSSSVTGVSVCMQCRMLLCEEYSDAEKVLSQHVQLQNLHQKTQCKQHAWLQIQTAHVDYVSLTSQFPLTLGTSKTFPKMIARSRCASRHTLKH